MDAYSENKKPLYLIGVFIDDHLWRRIDIPIEELLNSSDLRRRGFVSYELDME